MRKLDARTLYCTIKSCFNRPSWSSIAHNAKILFNLTDHIDNIEIFSLSVYDAIQSIENQMGPLDGHNKQKDGNKGRSTLAQRPSRTSNSEKKEVKDFYLAKPFFYCGELGHWVPNFQVRIKALKICAQNTPSNASIASYNAGPSLEILEALLDSGATHSIVGDIYLFTNMMKADMTLSVASNQKF
ncbi:hypothetical protein O181_004454 [Austropuccinia psidii MF-1]|uniref:Uncharacterized protein n=1 Tax=Austropuccinia psidii MF-1 TaxID=1389203 RepID=A0A9Q3GEV9_9BASI|nr:hypothetical protein [Austropuccinia psidii MF-1]